MSFAIENDIIDVFDGDETRNSNKDQGGEAAGRGNDEGPARQV